MHVRCGEEIDVLIVEILQNYKEIIETWDEAFLCVFKTEFFILLLKTFGMVMSDFIVIEGVPYVYLSFRHNYSSTIMSH